VGRWDEKLQDQFFDRDWGNAHFDILLVDGVPCGYTSVEDDVKPSTLQSWCSLS